MYFSLPHTYTLLPPPFHSPFAPLLFLFSAAPYKRQAQSQLQNDENEFSLQTKLKVSAVAGKIKKRRVEADEKGVGENEEWSSNENDAEHGKWQWEWGTGGMGNRRHTNSECEKIAHQIQRCAKLFFTSALQPTQTSGYHPDTPTPPCAANPSSHPVSLPHLPSCSGNMSCSCCCCRLHMGPCGHVAVWILVNLWLVVCMSPACRLPPFTPLYPLLLPCIPIFMLCK